MTLPLLVALLACGGEPDCVDDFTSCQEDQDCIAVPVDHAGCGCQAGGESEANDELCLEDATQESLERISDELRGPTL